MGYSTSPTTIHANMDLLSPILSAHDSQAEIIQHFTELSAPKKAAKIRECFSIARARPLDFPRLARIAAERRIVVVGCNVIARRIAPQVETYADLAKSLNRSIITLSVATSPAQIIQAYLDHALSIHTLVVESTSLNAEQEALVKRWIEDNEGWTYDWQDGHVTIHIPQKPRP